MTALIRASKRDQETIFQRIREGKIDAAFLSSSNLIDDIILSMHKHGVLKCLGEGFEDKRASYNTLVPFNLIMALSIAAKMRIHSSLTDIPYALSDDKTICELGYSLWDTDRDISTGLMSESQLRFLVGKYSSDELIDGYINTVQNYVFPHLSILPDIHILDCTKVSVNFDNLNFEESGMVRDGKELIRGYKLSTIRGINKDTGVIEDIRFDSVNIHDLELSREMILTSTVLKPNDILINDRGFLSRDVVNTLKTERKVDSYLPLKNNMDAYETAVSIAIEQNKWSDHPNKKRKDQKISFVSDLGPHWRSDQPKNDVEINSCIVWDTIKNEYFVFVTTDTTVTAKKIIQTYELRPEIEEDYRQLKDFWKLEDFKSTKLNVITFHIVCVLLGYLFFQLYTMLPEGEEFSGKSFPVIIKNYRKDIPKSVIAYADDIFGVFSIIEIMDIYAGCNNETKIALKEVIKLI